MKILIITTYYPPDTAIAAVRPYMFAKYLKQYGHDVTVLRSGLLQQSADRSFSGHEGIRVVTYLGENSPSMRFENGQADFMQYTPPSGESRIAFLPESLRKLLAKMYHTLVSPYDFYRWYKKTYRQGRFAPMKAAIDRMADERFDVVFSTYGAVENIWGGEYASKLFGAKWIQDFRDPIEPHAPNKFGLPFLKRIQKKAVRDCDLCTAVSEDLAKHLSHQAGGKIVHTLYNGYEPNDTDVDYAVPEKDRLTFCYTGTVYPNQQDCTPLLRALRRLVDDGKTSLSKVRILYAGKDSAYWSRQIKEYGLEELLIDCGYVSREESAKIQAKSDIFLVLSWNTKAEKGVLTGKLYEGIRAKKPILSLVAGDVPYSELNLINKKYNSGFCYENCREKEQFGQLCDYLEKLYREKMSTGSISYKPEPALETDFRYDMLSKRLEKLCFDVMGQKKST
ncbi:MAG: glycosyltransferase [Oscillospiraceae bacterium]|nr:glycosyltransferase [Oscillospiraceae bacterium]